LILGLAVPGAVAILLTTGAVLGLLRLTGLGASLTGGSILVFGAIISATDPIAVVALFKQVGAPKRLAVLLESESLLNDGTAAVFVSIVLESVLAGSADIGKGVLHFGAVVGAGLGVGAVVGALASLVMRWIDDAMIETTLTTIAAYGSFVLAEQFHVSGILATVVAGVVCGSYGAPRHMNASTRLAVASFWEYLAFALNSVVFLLIGFEVPLADVLATFTVTLLAYAAVTVARAAVVGFGALLASRTAERIPWSWAAVLTWGGLRGALSMVLVLGVPDEVPGRRLLVDMTFGVVTLSLLLQGTSMSLLLRVLGLVRRPDESRGEVFVAERRAAQAATEELAAMREGGLREDIAKEIAKRYTVKIHAADEGMSRGEDVEAERRDALRRLMNVEKDTHKKALRSGAISEETHRELTRRLDERLAGLADDEEH
jgi:CPA1 family monovalent cation:H+ antiporter